MALNVKAQWNGVKDGPRRSPRSNRVGRCLAALGLGALVGLVAACDLLVGAAEYRVGAGEPERPCGGFWFVAAEECGPCVEEKCCDAATACRESSECSALFDCLATCGPRDGACRVACKEQNPWQNDEAARAFASCRTQSCTQECVGCGGIIEAFASTCDACVESRCCAESTACATDPGCQSFAAATMACTDPWCLHFLFSHGFPPEPFSAALECSFTQCRAQCELGSQWRCVNAYAFQGDVQETSTFITWFTFVGTASTEIEVKACPRNDLDCDEPIDTAASAMDLAVTQVPGEFDGYFSLVGAEVLPTIYYHPHPLWFDMGASIEMYAPVVLDELFAPMVLDDAMGAIDIKMVDCVGQTAPGLSFTLSPGEGAVGFYDVDGYPVTGETETTATGHGGFVNVAPGIVNITATVAATGQEVAKRSAVVRPGFITRLDLLPAN